MHYYEWIITPVPAIGVENLKNADGTFCFSSFFVTVYQLTKAAP